MRYMEIWMRSRASQRVDTKNERIVVDRKIKCANKIY